MKIKNIVLDDHTNELLQQASVACSVTEAGIIRAALKAYLSLFKQIIELKRLSLPDPMVNQVKSQDIY